MPLKVAEGKTIGSMHYCFILFGRTADGSVIRAVAAGVRGFEFQFLSEQFLIKSTTKEYNVFFFFFKTMSFFLSI